MIKKDFIRPNRLEGKTVILDEITPDLFSYVIKWRNDPGLTKFLNQPYKLTMENEQNWYEQSYLSDMSQGFYIMRDRASGTPFGTIGWTDMDFDHRHCIMGRLLVGDSVFRGSLPFMEHSLVLSDWFYQYVDKVYIHVALENVTAFRFDKRFGFHICTESIKFPEEIHRNGLKQVEMCRDKGEYAIIRKKFQRRINSAIEAMN